MTAEQFPHSAGDEPGALDAAMEAGCLLLESGAEIFRVEDTMKRIAAALGTEECSFFVMGNGIIATGREGQRSFSSVRHIPVRGGRLDRIVAVNELSRKIGSGTYTPQQVIDRLREIRRMPEKPVGQQIAASAVGAACFCFMLGGSAYESAAAFLCGLLLWVFMCFGGGNRLSRMTCNILGGALVTLTGILIYHLGAPVELSRVISGGVIPLVPGVAFVNGIRDLADGDYISGTVRLLDALLVFASIAIGVGVPFLIYRGLFGGVLL